VAAAVDRSWEVLLEVVFGLLHLTAPATPPAGCGWLLGLQIVLAVAVVAGIAQRTG
jgi:hypothetical protein